MGRRSIRRLRQPAATITSIMPFILKLNVRGGDGF